LITCQFKHVLQAIRCHLESFKRPLSVVIWAGNTSCMKNVINWPFWIKRLDDVMFHESNIARVKQLSTVFSSSDEIIQHYHFTKVHSLIPKCMLVEIREDFREISTKKSSTSGNQDSLTRKLISIFAKRFCNLFNVGL